LGLRVRLWKAGEGVGEAEMAERGHVLVGGEEVRFGVWEGMGVYMGRLGSLDVVLVGVGLRFSIVSI
jgi:hypothetical protein